MPTKPLSKQWYFAFTGVPMICSSFLFVYDKMYFVEVNPCMFLLWQQQQQVKRRCSFCRSHPKTKERTGRAFLIIMIFIFLASSYLFLASSFSLFLSGNISCLLVHLIDQTSPTSAPFRSLLIRTSFLKRRKIQFFFFFVRVYCGLNANKTLASIPIIPSSLCIIISGEKTSRLIRSMKIVRIGL